MNKIKRYFIYIFAFLFACTFAFQIKINTFADSINTTEYITYVGAQIRTSGASGIRFVSHIDLESMGLEEDDIEVYGTLVGLGTGDFNNLCVDTALFNGKTIVNIEAKSLADKENNYFYGSLTGFVESLYDKEMTVRSYIKKNDGTYIYSNSSMVRTLAEGAILAINSGINTELINDVSNYLSNNYCVVNNTLNDFNQLTTRKINMKKYDYNNLNELYADFISDLNVNGLTTSSSFEDFVDELKIGTGWIVLDSTNIKLVKLFNGVGLAKWSWLLEYLRTFNNYSVNAQAYSLLHTRDGGSYYNGFENLVVSLWNFFHTSEEEVSNGIGTSIKFLDDSYYESCPWPQAENIKASNVRKIGESFTLPAGINKEYYDCNGYTDGSRVYPALSEYTISSLNTKFELSYSLHNYTITYFDNDQELTSIASTYTYSSTSKELATNPGITKVGYNFVGWHALEDLSDVVITSISPYSSENKVFYAEWEEILPQTLNITSEKEIEQLNCFIPNIIVKAGLPTGNYTLSGVGLDEDFEGKVYYWGETIFDDAKEALAAAKDNDTIYFMAGTHTGSEATLNASNVTIYGANYAMQIDGYNSRTEESKIAFGIVVKGNGAYIDGLNFINGGAIFLNPGRNSNIQNCLFSGTSPYTRNSHYGKILMHNSHGTEIMGNSFVQYYNVAVSVSAIIATSTCSIHDLYISGNYFTSYSTQTLKYGNSVYAATIYFPYLSGTNIIKENNFDCVMAKESYIYVNATSYTINSVTYTMENLTIYKNNFKNIRCSDQGENAIRVDNIKASCFVDIIGNTFNGVLNNGNTSLGRVFRTNSNSTYGTIRIKYNAFNNLKLEISKNQSDIGKAKVELDYNYVSEYYSNNSSSYYCTQENPYDTAEEALAATPRL